MSSCCACSNTKFCISYTGDCFVAAAAAAAAAVVDPRFKKKKPRQFQECVFDGNVARMFQLYSVQRTAHKVMCDALMLSLHEFWSQNQEFVTAATLSDIFGPSCAQTKLISDPKGAFVCVVFALWFCVCLRGGFSHPL